MRKGLTLTLMTVAIALVSVQAMAMAPIIGDIPSPIVGSAEPVTGGSKFVYIDAFNIGDKAIDDSTAQANLMWSFSGSSLHYTINGVAPLNLTTDDPTSPTTAKIINRTVAGGEWNQDANKSTLTIRNQTLSPLGTGTNTDPPGSGIIASETQLVTFFCSDGNAYSSKTVYFYTDDGGNDRLSQVQWTREKTDAMNMGAPTPTWRNDPNDHFGNTTSGNFSGSTGLCLIQPLAGDQWGSLCTDYGYFTLAANKVYRVKLTMNSSQTVPTAAPLWDFSIVNYVNGTTPQGNNMYAFDQYVYAAAGGANAIISSTGGTEMTFYWAPATVYNSFWTTNAFTGANAAGKDGQFRLRSQDLMGVGDGGTKSGSICITGVTIDSIDVSRMVQDGTPIVNLTSMVQANASGTGNVNVKPFWANNVAVTIDFSAGAVTLTGKDGGGGMDGRNTEIVQVYPATDLSDGNYVSVTGGDTKTWQDQYPIPWQDNKILKLECGISAPTATDVAKTWDAIDLGFDPVSDELIGDSYVTSSKYAAGPQTGTPQPYIYLMNTNKMSSDSRFRYIKWFVQFMNNGVANFPSNTSADALNTGAIRLHTVKVTNVKFQ